MAATSACTVPVDAVAGISVTENGRLLGVMMVCGHRIDGATLYVPDDGPDTSVTVGSLGEGCRRRPSSQSASRDGVTGSPDLRTTGRTLHGKLIQSSVRFQTYSHFTRE
ncbi:hypothetical protein EV567_2217 [Streptomyces sp. BK239]|nr:hypothetical protein EV567_2217 [Streptomyces sp. BK239]